MAKSYQDLDTRVRIIEDKLRLVMQLGSVTKQVPSALGREYPPVVSTMNLEELYKEIQQAGGQLLAVKDEDNGTDSE